MNIKHINKTTLIDYPNLVAATIWIGGCNFQCDYCYNDELVYNHGDIDTIDTDETLAFLYDRSKVLDGVVISGGEPTLQPDLIDFIKSVHKMGYKIKLDTNGYNPAVLEKVRQYVSYLAMDIKSPPNKYSEVTGVDVDLNQITESIQLARIFDDYEFRTTVWRNWATIEEFELLLIMINQSNKYFLQNYHRTPEDQSDRYAMNLDEINPYLKLAKQSINVVELRGRWR